MISGDGIMGLFTIIPILLYLALLVFSIYFIIRVVEFMNEKTRLDRDRNDKLDQLIKAISKENSL
ncbi:hypothetical protein ACFVHQ_13805 [Actinomycetes bacterium NPDC127524]